MYINLSYCMYKFYRYITIKTCFYDSRFCAPLYLK